MIHVTKRTLALLLASGFAVAGAGCYGTLSYRTPMPTAEVYVETEPPAPRVEYYDPRPGYVFIQGRWNWNGGQWVWMGGHWERERVGYYWEPGRWDHRGGRYVWVDGRWNSGGGPARVERREEHREEVRDHREERREERRDDARDHREERREDRDHRH